MKLANKEITSMEFAESCPVLVERVSMKRLINEAIDRYKYLQGYIKYEKALEDADQIMEIARSYALECLTSLKDGFYRLKGERGYKKAFALLVDRAVQETLKVYPWLAEGYRD